MSTPTSSTLNQQLYKILPAAFKWLFDAFNERTETIHLYKGYRLFAVDESDILISHDLTDKKTYSNYNMRWDIETIIAKEVEPRCFDTRKIRKQQAQFFIYRHL